MGFQGLVITPKLSTPTTPLQGFGGLAITARNIANFQGLAITPTPSTPTTPLQGFAGLVIAPEEAGVPVWVYIWMSGRINLISIKDNDLGIQGGDMMRLYGSAFQMGKKIRITGPGKIAYLFAFDRPLFPFEFKYLTDTISQVPESALPELRLAVSFSKNRYAHRLRLWGDFSAVSFTFGQLLTFAAGNTAQFFAKTDNYIEVVNEKKQILEDDAVSGIIITLVETKFVSTDYTHIANAMRTLPIQPSSVELKGFTGDDLGINQPYFDATPYYNNRIFNFFRTDLKNKNWEYKKAALLLDGINDELRGRGGAVDWLGYSQNESINLVHEFLFTQSTDRFVSSKYSGSVAGAANGWGLSIDKTTNTILFDLRSDSRNSDDAVRVSAVYPFALDAVYSIEVNYNSSIALLPGNIVPASRITIKINGKAIILSTVKQTLLSTDNIVNFEYWAVGRYGVTFHRSSVVRVKASKYGDFPMTHWIKDDAGQYLLYPVDGKDWYDLWTIGKTTAEFEATLTEIENIGKAPAWKNTQTDLLKANVGAFVSLSSAPFALSNQNFAIGWTGTIKRAAATATRLFLLKNTATQGDDAGSVEIYISAAGVLTASVAGQFPLALPAYTAAKYDGLECSFVYTHLNGWAYFYINSNLIGRSPILGGGFTNTPTVFRLLNFEKNATEGLNYEGHFREAFFIKGKGLTGNEVSRYYKDTNLNALRLPKTQLLGYWRANQSGGTIIPDLSGNGNHGTLVGFTNTTQGNINNAWRDNLKLPK